MKELATIKEVREITDKNNKPGWICKFESKTQIGTFYSQTLQTVDKEVMIQRNGNYFDFTEVATEATAQRVKAAAAKIELMWG